MKAAYYNEIDPYAAQWLRNLIAAGHIADGDVDERSIEDVRPDDIRGYRQCHFFAGIGVWSYALRQAGISDSARVWTGSCPCQPFSSAGKGDGFADQRHLWPAWLHLISQCEPRRIFGEQVASGPANLWIDLVQTDLEALGYALGAVPFPSAGVGAPHIRDRLYWLADGVSQRGRCGQSWREDAADARVAGEARGLAEPLLDGARHAPGQGVGAQAAPDGNDGCVSGERLRIGIEGAARGLADDDEQQRHGGGHAGARGRGELADDGAACGMDDAASSRREWTQRGAEGDSRGQARMRVLGEGRDACNPGPVNGFWRAADWLFCTDGKWRPVEPGTFPLAHGAAARVGRLRAYGNAINAQAAIAFVRAAL